MKKIKSFKTFIKRLPEIKTVDFRSELPEIKTVDFRHNKNQIKEEITHNGNKLKDSDTKITELHKELNSRHKPDIKHKSAIENYTDCESYCSSDINRHLFETKNKPSKKFLDSHTIPGRKSQPMKRGDVIKHLDEHTSSKKSS